MSANLKITAMLSAKYLEDPEALRGVINVLLEDVEGEVVSSKVSDTPGDIENKSFTLELEIAQEEKEDSE